MATTVISIQIQLTLICTIISFKMIAFSGPKITVERRSGVDAYPVFTGKTRIHVCRFLLSEKLLKDALDKDNGRFT